MHIFIVYAHPSEDSFTRAARDEFIRGLENVGHTYEISELYKMEFKTDMSEQEYYREANYRQDIPLADDVREEQGKINRADAIVFIYPVFWTEAPAKLVGWFDRVWTYGFAYGERTMKKLSKAIVICITGHSSEKLQEYGHLKSMQTVMLGDRLFDRVNESRMIVLDGMTRLDPEGRAKNREKHLRMVYEAATSL
jgi:NAD(P)H dehydrogenase (quinone)